jgi:hypothetical protein
LLCCTNDEIVVESGQADFRRQNAIEVVLL